MPKFALFYRNGKPKNASEGHARQPAWDAWFRSLGAQLIDRGAAARSLGVAGIATASSELAPTTGYSVISVTSEDEAMRIAKSCPTYQEGGVVEVARYVDPAKL
jgi:hypothetical protein